MASSRLSEMVARIEESTTAGMIAVWESDARSIRRDDPVGPCPLELARRIRALRAADDEEIGAQHPCAEDRIHIVGIRADRRDEAARAFDAGALQHVVLAGVGVDRQDPARDRRLIARGIALDHDEWHLLLPELPGHDTADPAEPADDEVVFDCLNHAYSPAVPEMIGQAAFYQEGGELGEGVERSADADSTRDTVKISPARESS